ncbi:hypothetical protein OSTOST_24116 [Ostertagia ostertagi]
MMKHAFVSKITLQVSNPLLPSLLLDVLVVIEGDVQSSEKKEKAVQKFTEFVNLICDQIIPADILRIELDVLDASLPANKQQLAAGKETPFSLYVVTSSLLREEMIDLMKITGFMVPRAEGIKETHRARAAKAGERARKAETILASNIPVDVSRNANVDVMDTGQSIVGVSFATVAAIQEADDAKLAAELNEELVLSTNQKLGLVCALIEDGAWSLAKVIIDRLPEYYAVQAR